MATHETGLVTFQIEIKTSAKKVVRRFYFDSDVYTAYDMLNESADRYDSGHNLKLTFRRTGQLVLGGEMTGRSEWM